jgi:hypothetical protein
LFFEDYVFKMIYSTRFYDKKPVCVPNFFLIHSIFENYSNAFVECNMMYFYSFSCHVNAVETVLLNMNKE